jgi:excisionase family DNA binding protein
MPKPTIWIGIREAARRLGVSRQRVTVWVREGRIPAKKDELGIAYLVRLSDLKRPKPRKRAAAAEGEQVGLAAGGALEGSRGAAW